MMSELIHVRDVAEVSNSGIVFDTNIWLYMYGPNAHTSNPHTKVYSNVYSEVLKNGNEVILENSVISEFANRFLRINHAVLKEKGDAPEEYKDFRKSDFFEPVGEELRDLVLNIVDDTTVKFVKQSEVDFIGIFEKLANGGIDYSDAILVSMCKARNYYLLTHDYDYVDTDVNLITGNNRYFSQH